MTSGLPKPIRGRIASSEEELHLLRTRLHDTTLQTLEFIANAGRMGADADMERLVRLAAREASELRHMLDGLTREEPLTLSESLREVVEAALAYGEERVELVIDAADDSVESLVSLELAAATREAITNARKHADASCIVVQMQELEGGVRLSVTDDGRGADLHAVKPRLGLSVSIKSRMIRLGGSALVNSAPGRGFRVTLVLPRATTQTLTTGGWT